MALEQLLRNIRERVMNARIWGIIGGVALVLALLSPLVLGSSQKVEQLFEDAEMLYERADYEDAIAKYKEALKESQKFGARTETIDKNFTTLANLKIAQCYYELAEDSSDVRHYQSTLRHIKEVVLDAQVVKHKEELTYLWAETLYKIGKRDQAKSKFSWLIEKFPNSQWVPKALYTIGEIHYQQKNYEDALNTFQKLVTDFTHSEFKEKAELRIAELTQLCDDPPPPPTECETMYNTASNLQQQGKVHDTYQLYTNLIAQFPECEYVADAYVGKAEIHLEAEDYANARINFEEAIYNTDDPERRIELFKKIQLTYLDPEYPDRRRQHYPNDELFVKARLLRMEGRFLEAAEIYEQLANRTLSVEDTVYALYWAGCCYHEATLQTSTLTDVALLRKSVGTLKKLITDYEDSSYDVEAYRYLTLTYTNWAEVSPDQSIWQLVIDTVDKAYIKYEDSDDTKVQGQLSRMQELKERATQMIDDSQDDDTSDQPEPPEPLDPSPAVLVNQGDIYFKQGKLEEATGKARQALHLDSNYAPACELLSKIKQRYYGLGWTFFDEEQYDKAIAAFKNAVNIDPKFKEAHNHLGVVYIKQGKYVEAIEVLEKAISIDGNFKEAYFNLALAYLEHGEFEAAINAANHALEIDPNYKPARMLIECIAD